MIKEEQAAIGSSGERRFDGLYKFLAASAVAAVIMPFVNSLVLIPLNVPMWFALLVLPLPVLLGYGAQLLFGKLTKVKRVSESSGYEGGAKYFLPGKSALTMTLAFFASLAVCGAMKGYMKYRAAVGIDYYYDSESLYPYLAALAFFILVSAGIILWFYPYYRLVTMKTLFPCLAALLICYITSMSDPRYVTICTIMYLTFAMTVLNQTALLRSFEKTRVGVITPGMRLYNIALVALLMLLMSGALTLITAVLVGIVVGARMLGYMLLAGMFRDADTYEDAEEVSAAVSDEVFNLKQFGIENQSQGKFYFWLFCLIVLLVAIFFIIARKRGTLRRIIDWFSSLYRNIVDFFMALFGFDRIVPDDFFKYSDYRDVEIKHTKAQIREYRHAEEQSGAKDYREFSRRLASMKDYPEKLSYAYNTLADCWRELNFSLRASDTPREICEKVEFRSALEGIGGITGVFETVKYALQTPDTAVGEKTLGKICQLVKKYLD